MEIGAFRSFGYLRYDPRMEGQKVLEPYWLILQCDEELCRYYRHWVQVGCYTKIWRPAWGAHISVIRGEKPRNPALWAKNSAKKVSFEYKHEILSNSKHYWIRIDSPELLDIREQYGLAREPRLPLHLTLGNAEY